MLFYKRRFFLKLVTEQGSKTHCISSHSAAVRHNTEKHLDNTQDKTNHRGIDSADNTWQSQLT